MSDNIQKKGYYIERLSMQNLGALDTLHKIVYSKHHAPDYFAKKYNTAYTGVEYIGYVAFNDERVPIAFYGVIPCFIRHNEQLYLAAQSADTMTHPKYRYKGLFVQLANLTFDLCQEEGISIVFGFPNQNSLHGFLVKLKWQMTETLDYYEIPVSMVSMERIVKRLPFMRELYDNYEQYILKDYLVPLKGIENSVFKDGFAGINRNALYLEHKTYHETKVIKIGDALLWIKIRNGLIIGDMICPPEQFDETMDQLYKIAFKLGLKRIQFHTSHQTQLSALFSDRYESLTSFYVLFKDLGAHIPLDKIKFTFADVDTF
ncbi:MAG: GNAT family N-acetyltransferase [Mucilaginibacter sp.]